MLRQAYPYRQEIVYDDAPDSAELEALAKLMDSVFRVPGVGIRFGLDALLGLIPGLGDTLTSLVSFYILHAARRLGVPKSLLLRMAANVAIDFAVGSIPFVGDAFDVFWKSNQKNVALLKQHLAETPDEARRANRANWLFLAAIIAALAMFLIGCVFVAYSIIVWLAQHLF